MTQTPIDLTALAGKRYQLAYDPAHKGRSADPWLAIVPCRYGHIYAHSATLFGVATNTRAMGLKLAKLPGCQILQEADDGFNLAFPASMFAKVAIFMKPKRRRQLSPEQRHRLAAAGKATRLKPRSPGTQSAKSGQNRPPVVPVDTLAV
jgi:hypothetical protein